MTEKYRKEAEKLYSASTESEIHQILREPFYDDENWKPLGDQDNNYGVVENQAAAPYAALTEIIVNSMDAILLKNYNLLEEEKGEAPEFETMSEAADQLVGSDEEVVLAADGKLANEGGPISLAIEDTGGGQPPGEFEDTFLGLLKPGSLKQDYEFVQGQYGMGSTGVLPFCGQQGYKLIISAAHDAPRQWSWSIIRKNEERTRYEYFSVDGEIPTFTGSFKGKESGSLIKLFNYQINQMSNISSNRNQRRQLERYLLNSPIPVKLEERRDYDSQQMEDTTEGMLKHIKNRYADLIKSHHHIQYSFDNPDLGTRDLEVILFRQDEELDDTEERQKKLFVGGKKHRKQAIFFSVNGQTHGDQGRSFLKNRCGLQRTADDILVFVDFSDITGTNLVNLFKPARDRLTDKPIAEDLVSGLEKALSGDEVILDEEDIRRRDAIEDTSDDFEEFFEDVLGDNPSLRSYFSDEQDSSFSVGDTAISSRTVPFTEIDYNPPHIPDSFEVIETFRARDDYDTRDEEGMYEKEIELGSSERVRFSLNAPDNYFYRENSPGGLRVTPSEVLESRQLKTGILSLDFRNLPNSEVGTTLPVTVEVERPTNEPLSSTLRLRCVESEDEDGEENENELNFQAPSITEVTEDEWERHGFGEDDVVRIDDYTNQDEGMAIFVNMDCEQLSEFISRSSLDGGQEEEVKAVFKRGVVVYSLSQYIEYQRLRRNIQSDEESEDVSAPDYLGEEVDISELVADSMRGVARSLPEQYQKLRNIVN